MSITHLLLVNIVDCKSQCNASVSRSSPTTSPLQRPAAPSSLSLASTGFIQVDRSPSGRCPRQRPCAVTLRAEPGQRINITLWDFTMRHDHHVVSRHNTHGVETCYRCVTRTAYLYWVMEPCMMLLYRTPWLSTNCLITLWARERQGLTGVFSSDLSTNWCLVSWCNYRCCLCFKSD